MSFGLEIFDSEGNKILKIDGRYTREYGKFSYNLINKGDTQLIPVPEMVDNDTSFAAMFSNSGIHYTFTLGGLLLENVTVFSFDGNEATEGIVTLFRY